MQHCLLSPFSSSLKIIKHVHVHANLLTNFHKYLLFAYMQMYIVQMDIHIHTHTYMRVPIHLCKCFVHLRMCTCIHQDRIWLSQLNASNVSSLRPTNLLSVKQQQPSSQLMFLKEE